jgi:hypothetical protein
MPHFLSPLAPWNSEIFTSQLRDWLYLEVESNQRKNEALQILDQIIKDTEPLWVIAFLNVQKRANFGTLIQRQKRMRNKKYKETIMGQF